MEKLLVILLCLPLFCNGQGSDKTLQPGASGEDLVNAVIGKIRSKCVFVDDKYMMRRIAAVDTDYGRNCSSNTGGIWQVNKGFLMFIKNHCQNRLRAACNEVMKKFNFDLTTATMSQLDTPLYSGIVMYSYISALTAFGYKFPASAYGQATFWHKYIRPSGSKTDFIAKSSIKISCSAVKMELVFAIDASGSVGSTNFQKTLSFLQSVVKDLQIASDMTRVAVIRYASSSSISFGLDAYSSSSAMSNAISRIRYTGGGTGTNYAIDMARQSLFSNSRANVPKVFVLITDGYSNNQRLTIAAADKLKNDTVTIFTIGIGRIRPYEMLAVASTPSCTHFFSLADYNQIDAIIHEIQSESCTAPIALDLTSGGGGAGGGLVNDTGITVIPNNPLPDDNTTKTQNINVVPDLTNPNNTQNTTTIKIKVVCGTVNIYGHHHHTPSASIYTYSAIAVDDNPGWIRAQAGKPLYLSLLSQKRLDLALSACTNPHYNITFNEPEDEGIKIICRENGKDRECTPNDIILSFGPLCSDDNVPNPCTKENILKNNMRFKHPKSTKKYIQCKLSGQMEIVTCPTGTTYDESQRVCGPQNTVVLSTGVVYNGSNPCTRQARMSGQFYFANPSDKFTFIQCNEWGTAFLVPCPNNTVWSQQAYTCVNDSIAVSPRVNPCGSSNTSYYENPASRRSFIQCDSSGIAYIMPCPLKTVWSQSRLYCVHDSIQLGLNIAPSLIYTTPPAPSSTTTKSPTFTCINGEHLPHKDPHKYYICGWKSRLTVMSCGPKLVWVQAHHWCNWPSGST